MPPTTTPVVTTPTERKLLTSSSTESASSQITALVFKDSLSTTPPEEVPDLVLELFFLSAFPLTTEKNPSSHSPSPLLLRLQPLLSNHTITSSVATLFLSIAMSTSALTTKPSTTCAADASTLSAQ